MGAEAGFGCGWSSFVTAVSGICSSPALPGAALWCSPGSQLSEQGCFVRALLWGPAAHPVSVQGESHRNPGVPVLQGSSRGCWISSWGILSDLQEWLLEGAGAAVLAPARAGGWWPGHPDGAAVTISPGLLPGGAAPEPGWRDARGWLQGEQL